MNTTKSVLLMFLRYSFLNPVYPPRAAQFAVQRDTCPFPIQFLDERVLLNTYSFVMDFTNNFSYTYECSRDSGIN